MDGVPLIWYKRLKWTLILFGVAIIATGVVYRVLDARQTESANSTNRLVCVTRPYILGALARAEATAKVNPNPVTRATARQAIKSNKIFLRGLVTVPAGFDCAPLIAQIQREAAGIQ